MTGQTKIRFVMLVPAGLIAAFLILYLHLSWMGFWLRTDGVQVTAMITAEHSKGQVDYKYNVNGREYAGSSQRNWSHEKYRNVHVGEESIMYYSSSHPGVSSLQDPEFPPSGLPVVIVALVMEFFFVETIINPGGKYALNIPVEEPR
jgi:hypothetical protein